MEIDWSDRFWSKVCPEPMSGCWLWTASANDDGYGLFRLPGGVTGAHRVAYARAVGPIPAGLCVMHSCDTPACVNPVHLALGTNADNVADRDRKGRQARGDRHGFRVHPEAVARGDRNGSRTRPDRRPNQHGERNPFAALTWSKVGQIRARYAAGGMSQRQLAREYGVSQVQIGNVIRGVCWNEEARRAG